MREILHELNASAATNGSMVITPDGIMVAAALGPGFEEDSMAAFAASFLLSLKRSLAAMRVKSNLRSCSLEAAQGKVTMFDMESSFLVLISDPNSDIDCNAAPIQSAIQKIKNRRMS